MATARQLSRLHVNVPTRDMLAARCYYGCGLWLRVGGVGGWAVGVGVCPGRPPATCSALKILGLESIKLHLNL